MDEQELARVREVVLLAHQEVVPELVQGGTLDELLGSVEGAKAAFARDWPVGPYWPIGESCHRG